MYWVPAARSALGLKTSAVAVPAEASAHRRPVAGSLQREGGLGGGLVHRLVEDGDTSRSYGGPVRRRWDRRFGCIGGVRRRELPGLRGRQRVARRGPWPRSRRFAVYWSHPPVGVRLEDAARAVPAEAAAHRRPVAGSLQREGGLGRGLVHRLVEVWRSSALRGLRSRRRPETLMMTGGVAVVNRQRLRSRHGCPRGPWRRSNARGVLVPAASGARVEDQRVPVHQPKLPLTGAPSLVRFSEKAAWAEGLSIA